MTLREVLKEVEPFKPMTSQTLYNYIRKLKIKRLGTVRSYPARYPDNTGKRLLKALGITKTNVKHRRAA
jgi:hypothetical protein